MMFLRFVHLFAFYQRICFVNKFIAPKSLIFKLSYANCIETEGNCVLLSQYCRQLKNNILGRNLFSQQHLPFPKYVNNRLTSAKCHTV